MTEFVAITNQDHAQAEASKRSKKADHGTLAEKNPDNLPDVCAERFHNSDFPAFLHGHGDERAHDSEGSDHHNEEKQKEHDRALQSNRLEILPVHIYPGFGKLRRGEEVLDFILHSLGAVRIVGLDGNAMKRVAQVIKFLTDIKWNEQKLGIVNIVASLIDAGNGQLFRQNDFA